MAGFGNQTWGYLNYGTLGDITVYVSNPNDSLYGENSWSSEYWGGGGNLDVNLNSTFKLVKFFLKGMIKRRFGRIIFITSVVSFTGNPGQTNYTASKSALTGLCKSLCLEVASRNITVNCIAPGFIASNMTDKLSEDQKSIILDKVTMKKLGNPSDIANTVNFLCSDKASYITGQTIHVNGGLALI